jgi:hypothetical protein
VIETSGVPSSTRVPLVAVVLVVNVKVPATFEVLHSSIEPNATGGEAVTVLVTASEGASPERERSGVVGSEQAIAKPARAKSSGSFFFVIVIHL